MPSKYLGNMVIAMQAIDALLHSRDQSEITIVIDEIYRDLVTLSFGCDYHSLFYPRNALQDNSLLQKASLYLNFARQLRQEAYDQVLDIDGTVVSARITTMARGREKIGPGFAKRHRAYTRIVPIDRDVQHCFDDFVLMANAIDVSVKNPDYREIPPAPDSYWDDQDIDLPAEEVRNRPVACIHPCATKDYKQWDIDKFAELGDWLAGNGWRVVIVGAGEAEKARVTRLLSTMDTTPVNAHGNLSLVELVWLLQHSHAFIGNDSGPMHLASASGVKVIALFGPTELIRWQPRTPKTTIIKGELPCSPECRPEACLNDYRCLKSLTVEQVKAAIQAL